MDVAGIDALKSNIDRYICSANDAVGFKMIRSVNDIEDEEITFHPDMSHQLFGEKEEVFGYTNLSINIYYTASQLHAYFGIDYSDKIDPDKHCGVQVDDISRKLKDVIPPECCESLDQFSHRVKEDPDFTPHGDRVYQYRRALGDGNERLFEMFNPSMSRNPGFKEYHERMQTLIMWFIDAASYIDVDDEKWEYYTIYEKVSDCKGKNVYYFVGYCTVYNFYAYPEHCRPRIAQFLTIPPYQRQGHATETIDFIQRRFLSRTNIRDICVEDPSENFQRIRDYIDCRNCFNMDCFKPEKIMKGYSKNMFKECNEKLKLNQRQTRRIYEILRLKHLDKSDEESFRLYRLEVKRRLNLPFTAKAYQKSFDKSLMPSNEERYNILEKEFTELLEAYLPVVRRLDLHAS